MGFFTQLLTVAKNILFPPRCAHCAALGTFLCGDCYNQIDFFVVPPALQLDHVASLTVCGSYDSPLGSLVKQLKYHGITEQAPTIAKLIWYSCELPSIEAISYIPMHPRKQKQREFNQTQLIAQELATFLQLPVVQYLTKNTHTEALALSHNKAQRLEIIRDSFSINTRSTDPLYRNVLLIDDVITTGTTLQLAASLLHKKYPSVNVHCCALAHRS